MLIGKKVNLRAVERSDLSVLRDWRNLPQFRRNFREHRELSMEDQERWFTAISSSRNDFMFVIEDRATGVPIGACGLLYTNWVIRSADFSFYIGRDQAYVDDQGYGFDAASLLIQYGFNELNLNRIWMELYEFDVVKQLFFCEQLGFHVEGTLRENCFCDGRYWDSVIVSCLSREFRMLNTN
jgi:RimJ/RimL family protein N-acetyltransferase